jgi:RNA polymerase sigma factor (sigma-70 family)
MGMAQGVRTPLAERSDDQLGALVAQGDEQAFAELYQRYFRGLYDFTLRTLRDREAASDVVQSTFVKAWAALRSPKGVENVKAWLYAVARNLAIDELRRRQRMAPRAGEGEEDPIYTIVDESRLSDPTVAAHDQELVDLVWESAVALSPSEYSLLDMHLRQGLDADEISEALGVAKGAVYTRLTRLRDSLDEAVTSSVLMKQARDRCEELDALLTRMNATELTREVKKAITEHSKDCEICGEVKRRLITPAELFAGLTLVPIPAGLMEAIWHGISTELGFAGAAAAGHAVNGHTAATRATKSSRHAGKVKAATALGTLGAVAVIGALLFPRQAAVKDPSDVHSTTHNVGAAAVNPMIGVAWTPPKGADAYSISWSNGGPAEPDAQKDLGGSAGRATSPALGPGSWWFNLRTEDHGDWTHTVHVGPFIIVGSSIQTALIPTSYTATSQNGTANGPGNGHGNAQGGNSSQTPLQQAAQTIVTAPLGGSASPAGAGSGSGSEGGVAGAEHSQTPGDGGTPTPGAPTGGGGTTTTTPTTTTPAPPDEPATPGTPEPGTTSTTTTTTTTTTPTTTTPTTTAPSQPTDKPTPSDPSIPPDVIEVEGGGGFTTTTNPEQGPFTQG